jgi:hypothetical protein
MPLARTARDPDPSTGAVGRHAMVFDSLRQHGSSSTSLAKAITHGGAVI